MQFDNKIRRAQQAQRHALGLDDPETRKARQEEEKLKLERGDVFSLLLSAFYMIFLPCVAVLVVLVMLVSLVFGMFSKVTFLIPILAAAVALWLLLTLLMRRRR